MLTAVKQNTFQNLQLNEGIFIRKPYEGGTIVEADIISATRGGATLNIAPVLRTRVIDGVHENTKGARVIDSVNVTASFTILEMTPENLTFALLGADYNLAANKILPRHNIKDTDYKDLYWLGEKSDGGLIQITFKNAINTGGLNLTVSAKNEGAVALTIAANYAVNSLNTPPYEIEYFNPVIESLPTPINLVYSNGKLTWGGDINATRYDVIIEGVTDTRTLTTIGNVEELEFTLELGTNTIEVVAIGDGINYTDSNPSAELVVEID